MRRFLLLAIVFIACGRDDAASSSGAVDDDAGSRDAGTRPPFDAGIEDASPGDADAPPDGGIPKIKYVFVLVKENHTFDSYFTGYPGAESSMTYKSGNSMLQRPIAPDGPLSCDVAHSWSNAYAAYDNGAMDGFSASSTCADPNTPFYRYTEQQIPNYWQLARNFVLADHFFSTLLTSTTPGHFATVAAQSPFYGNADSSKGCSVPSSDRGTVAAYNRDTCNDRGDVDACFDVPTIVDKLPPGMTWRAYGPTSGGNVATPFNFALKVGGDAAIRAAHFRSQTQLVSDLDKGDIPNLIYANVPGPLELSEHPPAAPCGGENFTVQLTNRLMKSAHWNEMAILITWDDWGGFYDHVPPALEKCQKTPGFRLPLIIASPYAKEGYVLKTVSEQASIARFIEDVFGMPRMAARDGHARDATSGSLLDAFDFTQAPRAGLSLTIRNCP